MPIEMYGESRFMHFWVDILIVLYIFGFGTARLGEWRLNHIHSINGAEVINVSCSDSSAEIAVKITYMYMYYCLPQRASGMINESVYIQVREGLVTVWTLVRCVTLALCGCGWYTNKTRL